MVNKYMYLYPGGGAPPASEAEGKAMMAKWMEYFGKLGPAVVDGGAPFAPESKFLGVEGSRSLRHSRSGFGGTGMLPGGLSSQHMMERPRIAVTSQPREVY